LQFGELFTTASPVFGETKEKSFKQPTFIELLEIRDKGKKRLLLEYLCLMFLFG